MWDIVAYTEMQNPIKTENSNIKDEFHFKEKILTTDVNHTDKLLTVG